MMSHITGSRERSKPTGTRDSEGAVYIYINIFTHTHTHIYIYATHLGFVHQLRGSSLPPHPARPECLGLRCHDVRVSHGITAAVPNGLPWHDP